jgi:glycosyltransferase involved in cell wall biosynthesis
MSTQTAARAQQALAHRLRSLADAWAVDLAGSREDPAAEAAFMLLTLLARPSTAPPASVVWAVYTAIAGTYPLEEAVLRFVRMLELDDLVDVAARMLDAAFAEGEATGTVAVEGDFVVGATLVDVDFSSKSEHNTGIQRVVRNTVERWDRMHSATLVAWHGGRSGSYRALTPAERSRTAAFDEPRTADEPGRMRRLIFPINSVVILTEVPGEAHLPALSSLARFSGNAVSAIGYDAIPFTSRETVSRREMIKFAKFLAVVKHMTHVSAISAAAATEFAGFARMVQAQGLAGPVVSECALPTTITLASRPHDSVTAVPVVLCVGSKEPRKNQVAVLFAAEALWREGLSFQLAFVGNYGWDTRAFRRWLTRLRAAGRPITAPPSTSDVELSAMYGSARFSIFPSLHEGYGLPVVESLSRGVPVITSDYGSTAEIAQAGGCLVVDPRDDGSITDAMRALLIDDALHARLVAETRLRPQRGWTDYADELWGKLRGA